MANRRAPSKLTRLATLCITGVVAIDGDTIRLESRRKNLRLWL